jgi:hypothetical protein
MLAGIKGLEGKETGLGEIAAQPPGFAGPS